MTDDGIEWEGAACPDCGRELMPEALVHSDGIAVVYACSEHGILTLMVDPFEEG